MTESVIKVGKVLIVTGKYITVIGMVLTATGEYVTRTGEVLTDQDIEKLSEEAERGYDVAQLEPVSDEEADRLRREHGIGRGDFLREGAEG